MISREDIKKRLIDLGFLPTVEGPEAAKARIAKDVALYKDLIARAKIPQVE